MQLKKCNSCHRQLTYDNYTIRRSAPDGYNPTCRECQSHFNRKSYQRRKEGTLRKPSRHLPLAEQNYLSISSIFPLSMPKSERILTTVHPRDVNPGQTYTLNLRYRDNQFRFELLNDVGETITKIYYNRQDSIEHILCYMADELTKRSIILLCNEQSES